MHKDVIKSKIIQNKQNINFLCNNQTMNDQIDHKHWSLPFFSIFRVRKDNVYRTKFAI